MLRPEASETKLCHSLRKLERNSIRWWITLSTSEYPAVIAKPVRGSHTAHQSLSAQAVNVHLLDTSNKVQTQQAAKGKEDTAKASCNTLPSGVGTTKSLTA